MHPSENVGERKCPVCDTRLPDDGTHRRCPRCGAKALWQVEQPRQPVDYATVLFNMRLCGIMAGLQLAMIALLIMGYRLPLPWGLAVIMLATPFAGYYVGGFIARTLGNRWMFDLLVVALAFNAGLLVALIAAILGLLEPVALGIIALVVTLAVRPFIHRAVARESADR